MKTILALRGAGSQGKSQTMRILHQLLEDDMHFKLIETNLTEGRIDFGACFSYKNKRIGLTSCGDNRKYVIQGLKYLNSMNCQICVCTCRSYGMTNDAIKEFTDYRHIFFEKRTTHDVNLQLQLNNEDAAMLFANIIQLANE